MAEQQINPCPFCGSEDVCTECTGYWRGSCDSCGALGPGYPEEPEAIAKWNAATPRVEPGKVIPLDLWTKRHELAARFASAWVAALSTRRGEPSYSDSDAAIEANRLGIQQADSILEMLAERAKQESPA